jgi:hypothetical protein
VEKDKYLDRSTQLKNQNQISVLDKDREKEPSTSLNRNTMELDDDENDTPPHWMRSHGTQYPREGTSLDRANRKDLLKFQSKDHRSSSNYFGIDEFSGDFNDDNLCPGSELRYKRYFNSSATVKSSLTSSAVGSKSQGESNFSVETVKTTRYRDSEVIVLTPGSRRQIQIKVSFLPYPSLGSMAFLAVDSNESRQ